eukprot:scaffold1809_cov228-Pinguiococcus_pyrenoidosus.AAC.17
MQGLVLFAAVGQRLRLGLVVKKLAFDQRLLATGRRQKEDSLPPVGLDCSSADVRSAGAGLAAEKIHGCSKTRRLGVADQLLIKLLDRQLLHWLPRRLRRRSLWLDRDLHGLLPGFVGLLLLLPRHEGQQRVAKEGHGILGICDNEPRQHVGCGAASPLRHCLHTWTCSL